MDCHLSGMIQFVAQKKKEDNNDKSYIGRVVCMYGFSWCFGTTERVTSGHKDVTSGWTKYIPLTSPLKVTDKDKKRVIDRLPEAVLVTSPVQSSLSLSLSLSLATC